MQRSSDSTGSAQGPPVPATPSEAAAESITFYHWLVVFFASCGWLFDCMGQRIFVLSREPAMRDSWRLDDRSARSSCSVRKQFCICSEIRVTRSDYL